MWRPDHHRSDAEITTIEVTGYTSPASGNWASPANGYYRWATDNPYPDPYRTIQYKAAAYGTCMNDLHNALLACKTAAANNLTANQGECLKIGVQTAGASLVTGMTISLTGLGTVPGVMIAAAGGTTGIVFFTFCNNIAANISTKAIAQCDANAANKQTQCDQWKP